MLELYHIEQKCQEEIVIEFLTHYMLKIFSSKIKFPVEDAYEIGESIGINWSKVNFSVSQFCMGLNAEHNEHGTDPETDVTRGDVKIEGKIAWAHLKEMSDYYTRLKEMESD